jgi:Serine acetyltransferase
MAYFSHPTAVIDDGAQIGQGTRVWHFSHVSTGARIGENVSIGQNVFIAGTVKVGNDCKIQNNVSLYDGVVLEDDVFCGPSAVFTNVYNPRASIERKNEYRPTVVRRGATLGANCTIVCGVTIGAYAFVGAGAVINRDVPDHALMVGVPARQIGWMSEFGERLPLPLAGKGQAQCPHTGTIYSLNGSTLTRQDGSHDGLHRSEHPTETHS